MSKKPEKKLEIVYWPIEHLIPYENNAKKHPPEQVEKIAAQLRQRWDQPIVVDKYGVIIKGHGRRLAAILNGDTKVPVTVRDDLSPEEVKAARLADNRVAQSDYDTDLLRVEMADIDRSLLETSYDAKELDFLAADLGSINADVFITDMDAVIAEQKEGAEAATKRASEARVPLIKAFGFKDVSLTGQKAIVKLMAIAETSTGLKGDAALVTWANGLS